MTIRFRAKFFFGLLAILYPLLVFCTLVVFKLPIRYLSIGIIIFAIIYSIINGRHFKGKHTAALFISPLILCVIGAISLFMDDALIIKLYPALADLAYLTIMITSFFFPPPFAYYFIDIFDKSMKTKISKEKFDTYCFRASIVWCIYFVVDGIISVITTYYTTYYNPGDWRIWGIYNGGITYVIMGLIFTGEFIILKMKKKKHSMNTVTEMPKEGLDVST
jgi:uncharacterized membrane protein